MSVGSQIYTVSETDKSSICIVFIHGLDGDLKGTWTNPLNKGFWPEWISSELDFVSVYTVGYPAGSSFLSGLRGDSIPDRAVEILSCLKVNGLLNKNLFFIVHSMGGLILKAMLREADFNRNFSDFSKALMGISFLATPHLGSDTAAPVLHFRWLLGTSKAIGDMVSHDGHLRHLNRWFQYFAIKNKLPVTVYCETEPIHLLPWIRNLPVIRSLYRFMPFLDVMPVKPGFCNPSIPDVTPLPISNVDHISICKPEDKNSLVFQDIIAFINYRVLEQNTIDLSRLPVPTLDNVFVGWSLD